MIEKTGQEGFSLIELLLVIVIIGIISAIGVPNLKKAKSAAENGAVYATMRTIASAQIGFYTNNGRYATLTELSAANPDKFGTLSGSNLKRGNFVIDMGSVTTSDPSLKTNFTVTATKSDYTNDLPYQISVSSDGRVVQLLP